MRLFGSELRHGDGGGGGALLIPVRRPSVRRQSETIIDRLEAERDRWFLWVPVFFGCGIGLYFALPFEPSVMLCAAPLLVALGLVIVLRRGTLAPALAGALLAASLGLVAAKLRTDALTAPVLAQRPSGLGSWSTIHGWLEERETRAAGSQRLTIRVAWIDAVDPAETPLRVRVTSRKAPAGVSLGDPVVIKAELKPPPDAALPGGYDFARIAFFQQLGAVGFLAGDVRVDPDIGPPPADMAMPLILARWREEVGMRIRSALPGDRGAMAAGLVTGERGDIAQSTIDQLRDSGLSHILAISGFNMAVMAGAVFLAFRALLALSPMVALTWPVKQLAASAGLVGAIVCLLLAGAGSATSRAFVMIALALLAVLLGRQAVSMRNLAMAGLVLLAIAPETLLDVGFQMSFSAVVGLMAVYERVPLEEAGPPQIPVRALPWVVGAGWRSIREIVASTAIATLAVAPFATFHFHKIAVFGLLANVAAVPLFTFAMMPLIVIVLAAMPFGLEYWPLQGLGFTVDVLMAIAAWVANLAGASIRVTAMPISALIAAIVGGLWLALWRRRWRWLGLAPLGLALALAGTGSRPDVLVARNGKPVAVRLANGTLSALPSADSAFTLSSWLEADGDARDPADVARGGGFFCDDAGCVARIGASLVAIPDGPAALDDDCRRAEVVIMRFERQRPCPGARLVVDRQALARFGTHALTATRWGWSITSVGGDGGCGGRPWCPRPAPDPRAAYPAHAR
jgi:competence protein ComEC